MRASTEQDALWALQVEVRAWRATRGKAWRALPPSSGGPGSHRATPCRAGLRSSLREFEVQPNGYAPRTLFLALLRDCRFFDVAGVQDHREEARLRRLARIPGH